jgi:hypothetical protein
MMGKYVLSCHQSTWISLTGIVSEQLFNRFVLGHVHDPLPQDADYLILLPMIDCSRLLSSFQASGRSVTSGIIGASEDYTPKLCCGFVESRLIVQKHQI